MELDRVLSDLESEGYACQSLIIPACAVDAKHRRDRVWIVGHTESRKIERQGSGRFQPIVAQPGEDMADTAIKRRKNCGRIHSGIFGQTIEIESAEAIGGPRNWSTEPDVGRVAHGVPFRVDRLKGLGNAIVPQVAFEIIKVIAEIENTL
jgi:DNA (cytosine-5)-methyltransferase 1